MPVDTNNSLSTARGIVVTNTTQTFTDWVGNDDLHDFYRFSIGGRSSFSATLNGLAADADIRLIRDANNNGVVDSGEVITGSYNSGSAVDSINTTLDAGTYYIQVYQYSGSTYYNLNLSASALDYAGNTLGAARNINVNPTASTFADWVGVQDGNDYYRFTLSGASSFSLTLNGLTADADVQLIRDANNNGVVDSGEVISGSYNSGSAADSLNTTLNAGTYYIRVYSYAGSANTFYNLAVSGNQAPQSLQFATDKTSYSTGETVRLTNTWVFDGNGASDLSRVDFWLQRDGGTWQNISDVVSFTPYSSDNRWASFNYSLSNLGTGSYRLWGTAYDRTGATSTSVERTFTVTSANPSFTAFGVSDASGDTTASTVFQGGAIRFSYNLTNAASLSSVRLEALRNGSVVSTLGTWAGTGISNALINLANFSSLTGGNYQLRAIARTTNGQEFFSSSQALNILSWSQASNTTYGSFTADTFNYSAASGVGSVFVGRGGTDTLNLGVARSSVASINGISLGSYNPLNSTTNQAIFRGTALDFITLSDGREIYFQGIENLRFSDGSNLELQVRANDPNYGSQWNLHVSDVSSAWRFTQGSSNVLLVSLDSGILTAAGATGGITDISTARLITDSTDDDNYNDYGHGHCSISVMSSTANNSSGIAGINWNSSVYVTDVYSGVSLQQGIRDAISYARARGMRVVFQGGVQGDYWLNSGGTQAQLEQLIRDNSDIAIFAIAAGNGGPGGNLSDPNYLNSVSGVARLETTHSNVMSVGALRPGSESNYWYSSGQGVTTVNGLTNATSVSLASYSNRGSNLTLVAATDSPAMDKFGNMTYFGGTSCANPNMAGISSLVWSVNTSLNAGQIRQIMIDTAMDLGTSGRDNTYGYGLVNADAAVRRALALARNSQVANLYTGRSIFA